MKNKSYYFSHDYNAANDTKILFLRHQLGMEGYGIYWFLIERLAEAGGKIPLDLIPILSMQMQSTDVKVKGVITQFDLFTIESGEFWSERLQEHLGLREKLSQSGKNGALNRWANREAIGEGNAKKSKEKENKVKESKRKESKEIVFPFVSEVFKKYWQLWIDYKKEQFNFTYKSNISIQATLNELVKLSNGNEQLAIKIIEQSMSKGWQGFFQLKNELNGTTNNNSRVAPKITAEQLHEAHIKFFSEK
jgi:uncharacterized protein YdaU (DUF1376 family)